MYCKTASIILNSGQKSSSVSDIFIAQPDIHKETLAGKLFILAEIESQKSEAVKVINFLINNINYNYYQNEKIILREKISSISVESIFETSIAKTNKDLVEFLTREKIKISPYAFNATICVLHKNELYFSTVGKNKNLLIYKEKIKQKDRKKEKVEERTEYKITDVSEMKERRSETVNLNKLFSDVVSGKIPAGGCFLIINEALSEYISNKQLVRIVTTLSPAGAAEQIKNILEQVNAFVSFLGVILKSTAGSMSAEELKAPVGDMKKESYEPEIVRLEEETEEILRPAGIIDLKKGFKTLANKLNLKKKTKQINTGAERAQEAFMFKDKIFVKKRAPILKSIIFVLIKIGKLIINLIAFLFKILTNKKEFVGLADKLKSIKFRRDGEKRASFASSKKTKIILIIATIFIIIFIINLIVINKKNKTEEEKRMFNALISTIEKNQNKVEANLLYNNEKKAKEFIEENKNLLSQIPEEEKEKKESIEKLFKKQNEQIEKIRHVIKINSPEEIANFSNLNSEAEVLNMMLTGNKIYSADSKGKAIYKIDLSENIVTAIYNLGDDVEEMKYPTITPSGGVYYLNRKKITELTAGEAINNFEIELANGAENISDIFSYSNKIYVVDKKDGQIYKYERAGLGFTKGEKWLNKEKDFKESSSLFIDGNIYILFKNGDVKKYLKGKEEEFSIESTYEPIENASSLVVTEKNIYILELEKKRVVLFDDEGKFQKQYVFPNLNGIKDFALNEKNKKMYILNSNSIYEITLE